MGGADHAEVRVLSRHGCAGTAGAAAAKAVLIHVDPHLVVADKPAGLLAVPGRGADKADCLLARLQAALPPGAAPLRVVHRLDMATSGLIVFARDAATQRALSAQFEARTVDKRYVAVVHGRLQGAGRIDLPVGADWPRRPRQRVDAAHGRPALTHWCARAPAAGTGPDPAPRTTLDLHPVTGRTHQLRVHLAALGHPVVGDALYGPHARDAADAADGPPAADAPRLLLHATRLAFEHPHDGRRMVFDSPAPFACESG